MAELSTIHDREFAVIRDLLFSAVGITLTPAKKALVCSRLAQRVQVRGLETYAAYFAYLLSGEDPLELQTAIDLLTTNETYFFREPRHFELLTDLAAAAPSHLPFRVWSAACSSGEEVYTIAMTLAELSRTACGPEWEVLGSDVSTRMLERACAAQYSLERAKGIPPALLRRYCLCGTGPCEGTLLIDRGLREKVEFAQVNLIEPLPALEPFNVIFLRNVMIYFDPPVKRTVVAQLLKMLVPGGVLLVGLAESLSGVADGLVPMGPGAYRLER